MPCDNLRWIVTPSFLPQICIVLEVALLKFHTKFAPGWAHIWVNFDPIWGNWAKSLGVSTLSWVGTILQDYGIAWCKSQLFVYHYSLTQHPMFNSHSAGLHYWWKDSVLSNWKHKAFLDRVLSLIASDQKVNPGKPPPQRRLMAYRYVCCFVVWMSLVVCLLVCVTARFNSKELTDILS